MPISQLIAKILLTQRNLNQIRHSLTGHIQVWHHVLIKSKSKFLSFLTKVNPDNGNETKPNIFVTNIFKSDAIFFYQKILMHFNDFQSQNLSVLWIKWTQVMEMKPSQTFFHGPYSNLTSLFIGHKVLMYFNDLYNQHLSILL